MARKEDERLQQQVQQKILSHGVRPPCRVTVSVNKGVVTLSGTVKFEYQRRAALHACRAMPGVKSVIDSLQVPPAHNVWGSADEWKPKGKALEKMREIEAERQAKKEEG
jgi:hypothetical protein